MSILINNEVVNKKQQGVGKKMRSSDIYLQSQNYYLTERPFSTYFQLKSKTSKRPTLPPSIDIFIQIVNKQLRLYMPQNSTLISILTAVNGSFFITFLCASMVFWRKTLRERTTLSMGRIQYTLMLEDMKRTSCKPRPEIRTGRQ